MLTVDLPFTGVRVGRCVSRGSMRGSGQPAAQAVLPQVQPGQNIHLGGEHLSSKCCCTCPEAATVPRDSRVQGTVGLGGVYLCIYPMNSPGGYQLMGRSLPIWNTFCSSASFRPGKPWLLEIFDQIRFYEVTEEELARQRRDFAAGLHHLEVTEELFDFAEHGQFCEGIAPQVEALRERQAAAAATIMAKDAQILEKLEAAGYTPGGGKGGATDEATDSLEQFDGPEFEKVRDSEPSSRTCIAPGQLLSSE